ncbi:hypothetical protein [uncultured Roseobacter sp.]|uniref:hypothetical protein n=1 Tax=uncultured Roseobacter sp. TaxID=114847 RepID=UPI0026133B4C|nr:hypothetical protein [uncultured Roseobacter sp.]
MARLTDEQQLKRLEEAQAKLAARKKAVQARLRSKDRKIRNRRISIIGAVVEAHAQHDAQFADYLWTILKNRVTRDADRDFLGLPPFKDTPEG